MYVVLGIDVSMRVLRKVESYSMGCSYEMDRRSYELCRCFNVYYKWVDGRKFFVIL